MVDFASQNLVSVLMFEQMAVGNSVTVNLESVSIIGLL